MKTGVELIAEERRRQVKKEGWTPAHDDTHVSGELNDAAICYAQAGGKQARGESLAYVREAVPAGMFPWPWEDAYWKPSEDQVRNLVKAGALLAAEIDRLLRAQAKVGGSTHPLSHVQGEAANRTSFVARLMTAGWGEAEAIAEWDRVQGDTEGDL